MPCVALCFLILVRVYPVGVNLLYHHLFPVDDIDTLAWSFHFSSLQIVNSFDFSRFTFNLVDGSRFLCANRNGEVYCCY